MDVETKIIIEISPYKALTILAFLEEFRQEMHDERLTGLKESIEEYKKQVENNTTLEQVNEAWHERNLKKLFNQEP